MNAPNPTAVVLAAAGTLLVAGYAAWAAFQILVLSPSAAVPGMPIEAIHAEMTSAQQWNGPLNVYLTLGVGVLLAVGVFLVVVSTGMPPTATVVAYLALLVLGAPGYFFASFGVRMGVADTFATTGADHSPWAVPLHLVSLAALVALLAVGVSSLVRGRRQPA
ncbi:MULTISPECIES: hypothetical protein [unclassified Microbacterium]|uniref:hypothetical protein n=1 Tax=unclassified Microbacterium TaxID=2609290 RepID=UPI00301A288E